MATKPKTNVLDMEQPAKVKAKIQTITPKMAQSMLLTNDNNRKIQKDVVRDYVFALKQGRWQLTGESVIIASTGRLLDGQHRLEAIVLADMPMECVLVEGVSEEAFRTIDTGMKRGAGQIFRMAHEKYSGPLSAACGFIEQYNNETQGQSRRTSAWRRLEVLEENPGLRKSAAWVYGQGWLMRHSGSSAVSVGVHYLTVQKHGEVKALPFWQGLESGAGLATGDARLSLRDWLVSYKMAPHQLPWPEIFSAYKNTWNAVLNDQAMYGLKRETSYERTANWEIQ